MFSSHYEGPGPSLFAPQIDSGMHCAPGVLFFTLLSPLLVPKWVPKAPQGSPKEPKGANRRPKASPGTSKKHKKIDQRPHLGAQGGPGGSRGTPGEENEPKSTKTRDFSTAPSQEKNRESDAVPIA